MCEYTGVMIFPLVSPISNNSVCNIIEHNYSKCAVSFKYSKCAVSLILSHSVMLELLDYVEVCHNFAVIFSTHVYCLSRHISVGLLICPPPPPRTLLLRCAHLKSLTFPLWLCSFLLSVIESRFTR